MRPFKHEYSYKPEPPPLLGVQDKEPRLYPVDVAYLQDLIVLLPDNFGELMELMREAGFEPTEGVFFISLLESGPGRTVLYDNEWNKVGVLWADHPNVNWDPDPGLRSLYLYGVFPGDGDMANVFWAHIRNYAPVKEFELCLS